MLSALKVSGIWLVVLWLVVFFIMGGFMSDYDIKSRYGYGEYAIYGPSDHIRKILIGSSLIVSIFISIIILIVLYFKFLKDVKKYNPKNNNDLKTIDIEVSQKNKTTRKIVVRKLKDGRKFEIHTNLETGYTEGDKVTIDGNLPENGIYKFGWLDTLKVENGKLLF